MQVHRITTTRLVIIAALALAVWLGGAGEARAERGDGFTTAPLKIGFVDIDRVTLESPVINKMMNEIEGEVRAKQAEIEAKRLKLTQVEREIQQKATIMTDEALKEKRDEAEQYRSEMEDLQFEIEKMVNQSTRRVVEPSMKLISEAIKKIGEEYEYDLILRGEIVLHGSRRVDLTKLVIYEIEQIAKERDLPEVE